MQSAARRSAAAYFSLNIRSQLGQNMRATIRGFFQEDFMKSFTSNWLGTIATTFLIAAIAVANASAQNSKQSSAPQAATKMQPLNVKPGLWETTVTYSMAGELPMSPEMLKKMTPEQRARLEEAMKAEN